jgi:hypothetical protein
METIDAGRLSKFSISKTDDPDRFLLILQASLETRNPISVELETHERGVAALLRGLQEFQTKLRILDPDELHLKPGRPTLSVVTDDKS